MINNDGLSTSNYIALQFLHTIVAISNSLFIIISGYYAINTKFNIKKVLNLWGKTLFYTLSFLIIYAIIGKPNHIYENLFPVISGQYWFITAYIALYLISPIISIVINKLSKNQFKYLLIILIVLYGIINIVFNPNNLFNDNFGPVILIYLIGAYIRLHVNIKKEKQYYFLKYIIINIIVTWLSIMVEYIYNGFTNDTNGTIFKLVYLFRGQIHRFSSLFLIFAVVLLFIKFRTIEIKNNRINKFINFISPSILSIYVIHENVNNRWLWEAVLNPAQYNNSSVLVGYIILGTICVFILCLIIDLSRRGVYSLLKTIPQFNKLINMLNEKIDSVNRKMNCYLSK